MGTRNIVAEFSCSIDSNGKFNKYEVVVGSSFTDRYTETLDSAVILLAHVPAEKQLTKINSYDFCRIYDTESGLVPGTTDTYNFDHTYLVDNWVETEERIPFGNETNGAFYNYTINLMSETKMLEKWQCPNLTITHNIRDGVMSKKTIFEKICEYMELYVPKVKKTYTEYSIRKWRYEPIIENPGRFETKIEHIETKDVVVNGSYTVSFTDKKLIGVNFVNSILSIEVETENLTKTAQSIISQTGTVTVGFDSSANMRGCQVRVVVRFTKKTGEIVYPGSYVPKAGYEDMYEKFNVDCADLSTNNFTLRHVLTALMQQVGCIPVIKKLKLSFLDFNSDAGDFALNGDKYIDNTVNFVKRSQSSDSYANTIINMPTSVLDSENEVVSEVLGFRDPSNVLLRQQENLFLTTKFPIYKVEKFEINFMTASGFKHEFSEAFTHVELTTEIVDSGNAKASLSFEAQTHIAQDARLITNFRFRWSLLDLDENGVPHRVYEGETEEFSYNDIINHGYIKVSTFENAITSAHPYFLVQVYGHIKVNSVITTVLDRNFSLATSNLPQLIGPNSYSIDITPLIKEKQERDLLEQNYKNLHSVSSIGQLSRFVYGTVGYTMGSNKIYGFSDYYEEVEKAGLLHYTYGQTYIEAIYQFLCQNYFSSVIIAKIQELTGIHLVGGESLNFGLFSPEGLDLIKFTQFTFNILYKPLNSFNMSFVKNNKEIDIPIEQFNGSETGTVDFDRLSENQQEIVDKIGNPNITISQRITPQQYGNGYLRGGEDFKPTYYYDKGVKNTIYQRTYTVGNYKYDVSYLGSEGYILKNFFTAIRSKYRAYEYVSLSDSTLRKEKDVIFVRITSDYFDGDDKVVFEDGYKTTNFITGVWPGLITPQYLKYVCEEAPNLNNDDETIKNEISLIKSRIGFAIIYEQPDNISAGPYIGSSSYQTFYDGEIGDERTKLGGVPQAWQKWNLDDYSCAHRVFYTSSLNFFDKDSDVLFYADDYEAMQQLTVAAYAPVLYEESKEIKQGSNVLSIVSGPEWNTRIFFKDYSERINHTVQFIYYSPDNSVEWSEGFIANNGLTKRFNIEGEFTIYTDDNEHLNENEHYCHYTETRGNHFSDYFEFVPEMNGEPAHINVLWQNGDKVIKIGKKISQQGYGIIVKDWIVFKHLDMSEPVTHFYVTLNDTKTDYVLYESHGMLYRRYKVRTGSAERLVTPLYNEE